MVFSFYQLESLLSYAGQRACQDKYSRWRGEPHLGGVYSFFLVPLTELISPYNQGARPRPSGDGGRTWSKLSAFLLAVDKHSNAKGQLERAACLPCAGELDTLNQTPLLAVFKFLNLLCAVCKGPWFRTSALLALSGAQGGRGGGG